MSASAGAPSGNCSGFTSRPMGSMNCGYRRAVDSILRNMFVGIIAQREFGFDACRRRQRVEISSSDRVETFSRSR